MQANKDSLGEQRRVLRAQLLAQRAVIAQQLDPVVLENDAYPRSMTMRFLTEHSHLAGGLFTGAASLLVGGRYLKAISTALAVFKMVREAVKHR